MAVRTFSGDFEDLARLIQVEWAAKYGRRTRFEYTAAWIQSFFGPPGARGELLLEYRNAEGALAGFVGATPRYVTLGDRELRLELVTLLTSGRRNPGLVAFELLREVFARARVPGVHGTYNCCLEEDRTPQLLHYAAGSLQLPYVEIAAVPSLMGLARAAAEGETEGARVATEADLDDVARLLSGAGRAVSLGRVVTEGELAAAVAPGGTKRVLVMTRDGQKVGACIYSRRRLLAEEATEVANVDLLVGPTMTAAEAQHFGKAISSDAAAAGATRVLGYQRDSAVFPYAREAGLRLAQRTLRVFVIPNGPENAASLQPGAAHLLEVE